MADFSTWLKALFQGAKTQPATSPAAPPVIGLLEADWPKVLRAVGFADPERWAECIAEPARRSGITKGRRAAAFAATIAHESNGGRVLLENLRYSAKRLHEIWPKRFPTIAAAAPFAWDPSDSDQEDQALANMVYGSRMGNQRNGIGDDDGWRYRGRGLIQLTGYDAYRLAGAGLGLPLEGNPDMAANPPTAAMIACWTWSAWKGCNALADRGDVMAWRQAINGGLNGLKDVTTRYEAALGVG